MFKFDVGDQVKDEITSLEGIITVRSEHLYGCNRYWVQPQGHKDGKPYEGGWHDEDGLQLVTRGLIERRTRLGVRQDVAEPVGAFDVPSVSTGPNTK